MAEGLVKPSAYIVPMRAINGAGTCGMERPFKIGGLNGGTVEVSPKATLACPMTASVDSWLAQDIQPAAMAWFGQPVAKIKQMSSYSCRNMNGGPAGKISEHAFGNGFDIGGFVLADGREVTVKNGWKGREDERGFLRTVQYTACQRFTTVLAPGSNIYHYDHIHVDLMRRTSGHWACNPKPVLPQPPMPGQPIYKAPPMAGAPPPALPAYYPPPAAAPAPTSAPEAEPEETDMAPGAPMVLSPQSPGGPAPNAPAYGGVDPGYVPPSPYPAQTGGAQPLAPAASYPPPAPSRQPPSGYPQQAPAANAPPRPNGVPLPPAGIPMVMRWLGLDPTPTGSTATRAYAPERQLATPIPPPPAPEAGAD